MPSNTRNDHNSAAMAHLFNHESKGMMERVKDGFTNWWESDVVKNEFPKWASSVADDWKYAMIEQKGMSTVLGESSRISGHLSVVLLGTSVLIPPSAPVTLPLGVGMGKYSFWSGAAVAGWDATFHDSSLSATAFGTGYLGEYLQSNMKNSLGGVPGRVAYSIMEVYQSGGREVFYQMGQ